MDKVSRAVSDPAWRVILGSLRSGGMGAGGIARHFPIVESTLSGRFDLLKDARLLVAERRGARIVYGLNVSVYEEVVEAIVELLGAVAKRTPSGKRRRGDACQPAG